MSTLITVGNGMGKMRNVTLELGTNAAELNPDPDPIPNSNGVTHSASTSHNLPVAFHILPEPNCCCA